MPSDDGWNWPYLLYIGTVLLRRTEAQFWKMTPRTLLALVEVHIELNSSEGSRQKRVRQGYIDEVIF